MPNEFVCYRRQAPSRPVGVIAASRPVTRPIFSVIDC